MFEHYSVKDILSVLKGKQNVIEWRIQCIISWILNIFNIFENCNWITSTIRIITWIAHVIYAVILVP